MYDVRALNELVARESAFVDKVTNEVGKVIVGQTVHDRADPDRAPHGRARAPRRGPRARQDAHGPHAVRRHLRQVRPHPVHARPPAGGPHRHGHLQPAEGGVHLEAGPGLREPRPGRRDQPRAGEGAERPARGDAGAPGHDRRQDVPAPAAVRRHGDAEPDRARGDLPAPRGAGRPLHADGEGRLPDARGGAEDHGPDDRRRSDQGRLRWSRRRS